MSDAELTIILCIQSKLKYWSSSATPEEIWTSVFNLLFSFHVS